MSLFKEKMAERLNESTELQKAFFEDMSYKMRNPLNAICGITEIVKKNSEKEFDKDQFMAYIDMLQESANELKFVVDECFSRYETIPASKDEANNESDYDILRNLRIMIVEDAEINQMVVKELLGSHGAIITVVENGHDAVELFTKSIFGTFDVILMDINMPVMDGYEATDRIRNSGHTQAKSIPIIAVTGDVYANDIQMALKSGMNAHVAKPYSLNNILSAIKNVL